MRHYKIMFDNTKITVYFNEHIRCFYDGTIERLQIKNGNTTIVTPKWKILKIWVINHMDITK